MENKIKTSFWKYFHPILKLRFKDMKRNGMENKKRRDSKRKGERWTDERRERWGRV